VQSMNQPWTQEDYLHALHFAARAHAGQTSPGSGLPYIVHPVSVAMEVIAALAAEPGRNEVLAVQCALLHDVIEDTSLTYEDLRNEFGAPVAEGVLALSKDPRIDKESRMADSLARIRLQPAEVWLVKLADRITNLQPPPAHWTPAKIAAYRAEAEQILFSLAEASPYLRARLEAKITGY
jgi:(p)ppGpp synthase/HD superfamily hydrolase